ncbi:site-specific DNA recombinase [Evansella vedderi]|uniref:Site-specific DNA recombinase n=1 Tax=Evansella vedderi TaxID=38282 RepID=A0ABT9ZVP5_9BACI|nr:recombinase family protein [Evansella vedderi]MDQ0255317.1 site-specific DNA recombinase [Evansella vedderi]
MNKVIIYVRVSTEEQADKGYSIESQLENCMRKALELGYTKKDIIILKDDVSGSIIDRPGLNRLRELINGKEKPDIVIVYEPDRLTRQLTHQLIITDEILKNNVRLEFIKFEWKNTPEGMMYYQLQGIFAQYEREKIRERTIRGRMTKLKKHGKLSYDPRLYGYTFDTHEDKLKVDPAASKVVQLIFKLSTEGKSCGEIVKTLTQCHVPAPRGSKWYPSTVSRILNNKSYLGTYMTYKTDYHQGVKRVRTIEEQFPISIEPLITEAVYRNAQQTLAKHRRYSGRPSKREHLLAGLAKCYCGHSIVTNVSSGKYAYYTCVTKLRRIKSCQSLYWNTSIVDQVIWSKVCTVIKEQFHNYGEILEQENITLSDDLITQMKLFEEQQNRIQKKQMKVLDLVLEGKIDHNQYDYKLNQLSQELLENNLQIQKLDKKMMEEKKSLKNIYKETFSLPNIRDRLIHLPFKKKKEMTELIVDNITLYPDYHLTLLLKISE